MIDPSKTNVLRYGSRVKPLWVFEGEILKVLTKATPWALPKPTCFLKKARQKLLLKPHIHAVLDGSSRKVEDKRRRWASERSPTAKPLFLKKKC